MPIDKERMNAFLEAVARTGIKSGGNEAACHHSAVEVNDWEVVQLKRAMIETADKVVSLSISEKINTTQRIKVCDAKEIDVLVTELNPENALFDPYKAVGMDIL